MELKEEKKQSTDLNLYIIRLVNRLYYLMSCQNIKDREVSKQKLEAIHEDLKNEQAYFRALAKEFTKTSLFKHFQVLAILEYEKSLTALFQELIKEVKPQNNFFALVFSKINNYTILLNERNVTGADFKELTDFISRLRYNFNDEALDLFNREINSLFLETLRVMGIEALDELINSVNPYFYPSLILYAEAYVLNIMLQKDEFLYQELLHKKEELDAATYLKELFINAYNMGMLGHEALILPSR